MRDKSEDFILKITNQHFRQTSFLSDYQFHDAALIYCERVFLVRHFLHLSIRVKIIFICGRSQ